MALATHALEFFPGGGERAVVGRGQQAQPVILRELVQTGMALLHQTDEEGQIATLALLGRQAAKTAATGLAVVGEIEGEAVFLSQR